MRSTWPVFAVRPAQADSAIALALACELELEAWLSSSVPGPHRAVTAAAAVLYAAPVAARRRWPVASLLACAGVAVLQAALHGNLLEGMTGMLLPPLVLSYSTGRQRRPWPGGLAVLSAAALLCWGIWLSSHVPEPQQYGSTAQDWISAVALVALPWLAGLAMTSRGRRAAAYRRLTQQVAQRKSEYERLVVLSQRIEICEELDGLLAHAIAAIELQAAGARLLMDKQGAASDVEEAIAAIERSSRAAMEDLRRYVSLVRSDQAVGPSPRLAAGLSAEVAT